MGSFGEETKEKLRKANLGKKLSEETKKKILTSLIGRPCSNETKIKISASNKGKLLGRKLSIEHMNKIIKSNIGKKRTNEYKERMSNKFKEKFANLSIEGRRKISNSKKRKIIQFTIDGLFIKTYNSIREASNETGISHQNISANAISKGKERGRKTIGGYIFRYEDDTDNIDFIINKSGIPSKSIMQYTLNNEFIAEYISISEAGRQLNINRNNISMVCNGKRKSAGGYIWRFAEVEQ